jgi:hypothetical protein
VVNHHVQHFRRQPRHCSERVQTILRMLSHHGHFGIIEPARLFQNSEQDAGLADVVQHSREGQPLTIGAGRAELLTE